MKELDALTAWNAMPWSQRGALLSGLQSGGVSFDKGALVNKSWAQIDRATQKELLKLDWNFMLGGKLGMK